ncbi:MAG TPA: hypothetical protein VFC01_01330 [Mycobacterium sp.]|jgi:hypothetical protein|nr:hypothetical protein [Mycobacterium sp.]
MDVMLGGVVQNLQRHGAALERVHVDPQWSKAMSLLISNGLRHGFTLGWDIGGT